jgi:membrane-associated phospholipid phosphatase
MSSTRLGAVLVGLILVTASPAAAQTPDTATSRNLFKALAADFRHFPSKSTALTLGIGGAIALSASPADARLTREARQSVPIEETLDAGAVLGGGLVQLGGAVGSYAVGRLTSNAGLEALGSDLIRAQAMSGIITHAIKFSAGRTRPDGSRYSFPSGHTSASFATAAVLAEHFGWKVGLPAYAAAAYVGTSRLSENKHYASDVIFGAAIGLVAGRTVTIGKRENQFALAPVAYPGGFALSLSKR